MAVSRKRAATTGTRKSRPGSRVLATQAKSATKPKSARKMASGAAAAKAVTVKKVTAVRERMNKTALSNEIANSTGLSRKQVASVLEALNVQIERHMKKRAVGEFVLPGIMKIRAIKKPARKARKGVPNPFRPGETMDVTAKPASLVVKIRPLKKLKDMTL